MTGTVYSVLPIPPDPEHTSYVECGGFRIGVEYRLLDDAELAANYEGDAMEEIQDHLEDDQVVEDNGVSLHVLGADGHEYLRFDCFEREPHYHYIEPSGEKQTIIEFDRVAHGEMIPWAFAQLRGRLAPMLEHAGGGAQLAAPDRAGFDAALPEVEALARSAADALAAGRKENGS